MVTMKSMDYPKKWVVGFGTLPFIICSILLGALIVNVHIALIALLSYLVSTTCYQKLIVAAPKNEQKLRFGVFLYYQ